MQRPAFRPVLLRLGLGAITACGGGDGITPPPPPPPTLGVATIEVTGPTGLVTAGAALPLTAVARNASGAPISGVSFTWQSSAVAVATVSGQGLVQAVGAGTATITASAENRSGAFQVTVRDTTALPAVLTGKIERVDITIGDGQRHRVSGDLVLVADSTLLLAGILELDSGASLTLYGGKLLRMTGIVAGDSATRLVLGGGRLEIVGEPPAQAVGGLRPGPIEEVKGNLISRGPVYLSATFVVIGPGVFVTSGSGRNGTTDNRPGGPGEPLEIGTAAARTALGQGAGKPDPGPTASLLIDRSSVFGGDGGEGFTVRRRDDGAPVGDVWTAITGSGGKGGPLLIEATVVDLRGSLVRAGQGGRGGNVGRAVFETGELATVELLNGSRPDKGGEYGDVTTGNGGDGGDLSIIASAVQNPAGLRRGSAQGPGSVRLGGGNGIEGGPGGKVVIQLGLPGQPGQVAVPPGVPVLLEGFLLRPDVVVTDALNGGGSIAQGQPGGAGGILAISQVGGGETTLVVLRFVNTANGGPGFDGCSVTPRQNGSNGGKGGERTLRVQMAPLPASGVQTASLTEVPPIFSGGNGGDGVQTAGAGGDRGQQFEGPGGAGPIGEPGMPGVLCPPPSGLTVFPTAFVHSHKIGVNSCPDPIGQITLQNLTTTSLGWQVSAPSGSGMLISGGVTGTVAAGASTNLGVAFNCFTQESYNTFLNIRTLQNGEVVATTPVTIQINISN